MTNLIHKKKYERLKFIKFIHDFNADCYVYVLLKNRFFLSFV